MTTILNQLADNPGARRKKKLLGRGIGSGKGKTSGRGGKGQTARTGVAINGFEGGQTPIHRRLPKRGFNSPFGTVYEVINLDRLQDFINRNKLDAKKPLTLGVLRSAGLLKGRERLLKLLAKGAIKSAIAIEVHAASPAAIAAIEKAGGKVTVLAAEKPADKAEAEKKPAKKPAKSSGKK